MTWYATFWLGLVFPNKVFTDIYEYPDETMYIVY